MQVYREALPDEPSRRPCIENFPYRHGWWNARSFPAAAWQGEAQKGIKESGAVAVDSLAYIAAETWLRSMM